MGTTCDRFLNVPSANQCCEVCSSCSEHNQSFSISNTAVEQQEVFAVFKEVKARGILAQGYCTGELFRGVWSRGMKQGAIGLNSLSVEHILYSQPVVSSVSVNLFNAMVKRSYVPGDFGIRYTERIHKSNVYGISRSLEDFRVISK